MRAGDAHPPAPPRRQTPVLAPFGACARELCASRRALAPGAGWCLARRIAGSVPQGELFRFGEPLERRHDCEGDPHEISDRKNES